MNKSTLTLVWKLLLTSFFVGLALNFFNISPTDLIHDIPETVARIYASIVNIAKWSGKYILLGAIIVVPLWLLMNITRLKDTFKRRN